MRYGIRCQELNDWVDIHNLTWNDEKIEIDRKKERNTKKKKLTKYTIFDFLATILYSFELGTWYLDLNEITLRKRGLYE